MHKLITRARERIPYIIGGIEIVWRALGWIMILWLLIVFLQGLIPGALTYLLKLLVDQLVLLFNDWSTTNLQSAGLIVGLLVFSLAMNTLLRNIVVALGILRQEQVTDHVSALIHKQAVALDLSFFESSDYYDSLHRASTQARNRPLELVDSLANILRMSVGLLSYMALLSTTGLLLPVVVAISTLPMLYVITYYNRLDHQWQIENTPRQRRAQYFDGLLTSRETAPEIRVFNLGTHFQAAYGALRANLRNSKAALARRRQSALSLVAWVLYALLGSALAITLWQTIQRGTISAGDVVLLFQSLFSAQAYFTELQSEIGKVYQHALYLEHLFIFLKYEPRIVDTPNPISLPTPLARSIDFRAVRFRYPGSERWSLDGLDLSIPIGKTIALVGENGAGKSTLIKLLCRLYDPDEGSILLDDIDLRHIRLETLRERIAVLFQQPVYYDETARENIALGALHRNPSHSQIEAAAQAASADSVIAKLPHGYDTPLGKRFGDEDLSVGEWQRLALARALLKPSELIIMDEPTSAMDSWAEAQWLSQLRQITTKRTAIIVTHRFTTAMQADLIYVIEGGRIVESGTHDELINCNSRYAASWKQQNKEHDPLIPVSDETLL